MRLSKTRQVFGLLAGCLLGTATAQLGECSTSTEAGFDYEVAADTDFTVYWTVDTTAEEISFQVVYEGEGWVALGFSTTGAMVVADAVIGLPDDGTALEYDLSAYSLAGVTESSTPEITGATVTQVDSTTTLAFTRPLAPEDTSKTTLSSEEGVEATFIWGRGRANDLAKHPDGGRGSFTVTDLFCGDEDSVETDTAATCASSDPDYDFEVAPHSDLALFWSLVEDDTAVSVKAVYQGEGWLGIGFSDSGRMAGSDSVIGLPDDETALEYDMDDYNQPVASATQEITEASIAQTGGVTTLTFIRPLDPEGDGKQVLTLTDDTAWLYAWGGSNTFVRHATEGSLFLGLSSCEVSSTNVAGTSKEYAHGWLMVLGWTVCFPVGIMYARFSESFVQLGFPAHRVLQSLGATFAIAGFITALVFTEDSGQDHFHNTHGMAGLILMAFIVLQVVAAIFRPHALPKGAMIQTPDGQEKPAPPSKVRRTWSFMHKSLGYIAVIWAVLQCFGGIDLVDVKDRWVVLYLVLVILVIGSFLLLQLRACCKHKRRDNVRQLSGPQPQSLPQAFTNAHR